jgi:hypothetical protein
MNGKEFNMKLSRKLPWFAVHGKAMKGINSSENSERDV